jgi:hypothetical protein
MWMISICIQQREETKLKKFRVAEARGYKSSSGEWIRCPEGDMVGTDKTKNGKKKMERNQIETENGK